MPKPLRYTPSIMKFLGFMVGVYLGLVIPVYSMPIRETPSTKHKHAIEIFANTLADAESGDARAQFDLSSMYTVGSGVSRNEEAAVKWLTRAAEQGLPDAQYTLAVWYTYGEGGLKSDDIEAFKWADLAAEQGYSDAIALRDELQTHLDRDQITDAISRSLPFRGKRYFPGK